MQAVEYYVSPNRKSAEICHRLTDTSLVIEHDGGRSKSIELTDVVQVGLVKRRGQATCRIQTRQGDAVRISSLTIGPDGERISQAADYAEWVDALHERLVAIGRPVVFRGQDRRMFNSGLFLFVACVLPPVTLFLHALAWGDDYGRVTAEALFWIFIPVVACGLLIGAAKTIRGLPRAYRPQFVPFELLPATGDHIAASSARIGAGAKAINPHHQVRVGPMGGERFQRHSPFGEETDAEASAESTQV